MPVTMSPEGAPHRAAGEGDEVGLPAPIELRPDEQLILLALARTAVAVAAGARPASALVAPFAAATERVRRDAGAFVTLTASGELRGCMGSLDATVPLAESVLDAAVSAARRDPRFEPVGAPDVAALRVEVSVLGPFVPLEDPERFRLGVDGLLVERDGRRGLLLPEVPTTYGIESGTEMLDATCGKAGLPAGAWRRPGTHVFAFRTARFGDPADRQETGAVAGSGTPEAR